MFRQKMAIKKEMPAHFQISTHEIKSARGRVPEISGNTIWLWLTVCHGKIHHAMKIRKPSISMDQMVYGNILNMFQSCKFTWRTCRWNQKKQETPGSKQRELEFYQHGWVNPVRMWKLTRLTPPKKEKEFHHPEQGSIAATGKSWSLLTLWGWVNTYRSLFGGMNIHLPAILMFTRGTRFWHTATLRMATSITLRFTRKFWVLNSFESTTASSKPWAAQERSSLYVPGTQFGPSTRMNSWSLLGATVWFPVVSQVIGVPPNHRWPWLSIETYWHWNLWWLGDPPWLKNRNLSSSTAGKPWVIKAVFEIWQY